MAMEKTFDAAEAESRIYAMWEEQGCFAAGANKKRDETFTICIPPPNVTGSLHMGHALNNTLQDILVRWHRMRGFDTLWQPGTDHAGIATQMVVERKLNEQGKKRTDFSREDFIAEIWKWKEESGGTITNQLKRLGASCDWDRTAFTMSGAPGDTRVGHENSPDMNKAVMKTFVDLYNKGLIYKGKRLVNWDPHFETAISDLEVENIETPGHMWHFKYPLAPNPKTGKPETYEYVEKDEDGQITLRETRDYISIATTRPETMLGDGAVAVHPDDERYAPIIGKLCEIPVGPKQHRRLIPIITDEYPDPAFGSGAVKITGAHDFNDYQVAKRNNIPCYNLMDTKAAMRADGKPYAEEAAVAQAIANGEQDFDENMIAAMNLVPDEYRGLDRLIARKRVVADITAEGLAVMVPNPVIPDAAGEPGSPDAENGSQPNEIPDQVGDDIPAMIPLVESKPIMQPFGDRSKVVIEPLLTDQWFVDAHTLAQPALEAVRSGKTEFVPKNWEKTYFNWLDNIEPWCISRQLWWGHQVPVWYGPDKGGKTRAFCAESKAEALEQAREYYASAGREHTEIKITDEVEYKEDYYGRETWTKARIENPEDGPQVFTLTRDPDVLDTWFSSALWPFSTLGWPEETPELARYYKTDVLVTGFDIIFFWVARMMMMGLELKDEVPFHTVYVHALVRDEKGAKMSKSVGNVIDPLDLIQGIDIDGLVAKRTTGLNRPEDAPKIEKQTRAEYPQGFEPFGADALRFALTSMAAMGRDIKLSVERIRGYRNFGTKLWNAARFAEFNACERDPNFDPAKVTETVNKWIIGETAKTREAADEALTNYRFNDVASTLFAHVYFLCDWYVEFSKPLLSGEDGPAKAETKATVVWAIDQCLVMLSPIMPFITEELWKETGGQGVLMHHDWPTYTHAELKDDEAEAEMRWTISLIEAIRSVRSEMNVPAAAKIDLLLTEFDMEAAQRLLRQGVLIKKLARLSEAAVGNEAPKGCIVTAVEGATVNLPLADLIDVKAETARLTKSLGKLDKEIKQISSKLGNEKFMAKAPEEVVAEQRERLAAAQADRTKLANALSGLEAIN